LSCCLSCRQARLSHLTSRIFRYLHEEIPSLFLRISVILVRSAAVTVAGSPVLLRVTPNHARFHSRNPFTTFVVFLQSSTTCVRRYRIIYADPASGRTTRDGIGSYTLSKGEYVLIGIRGRYWRNDATTRQIFLHPKLSHSEKPHEIRTRNCAARGRFAAG